MLEIAQSDAAAYFDPWDTADVAAIGARIADEDGNVRVAALQALGEMGAPRTASLVANVVRDAGLREGIRAVADRRPDLVLADEEGHEWIAPEILRRYASEAETQQKCLAALKQGCELFGKAIQSFNKSLPG